MNQVVRFITATDTRVSLNKANDNGGEFALLDVREAGQYGEGHPFFSVNVPYSRLECLAPTLLPSKNVPIVVFDDGDGVGERACRELLALGYLDVQVMEGGAPAWASAGYVLFKGVNLPSKAFGELVEHALDTPHVSANDLDRRVASGEDIVIFDGRTPAEYRKMTIPGASSCPNAELPLRIPTLVDSPSTTIVINCAGRTRSIIGAENVRLLGLENPIVALENGTQGWQLAGLELDRGREPASLPELSDVDIEQAKALASDVRQRFAIPTISLGDLAALRNEARALHVLDVRTAEEFSAGHLPGSVHAPGGQLAQATDQWVAGRGACIVLVDPLELRAAATARWLRGMGHDARVVAVEMTDLVERTVESGPVPYPAVSALEPAAVREHQSAGVALFDVSASMSYRAGHIAGARWLSRAHVPRAVADGATTVMLVGDDADVVGLVAKEFAALGTTVLGNLPRDVESWTGAGLSVEVTPDSPSDEEAIDYLFFVHDRHDGNMDAARAYLAWETGLMAQMDEDETAVFQPA